MPNSGPLIMVQVGVQITVHIADLVQIQRWIWIWLQIWLSFGVHVQSEFRCKSGFQSGLRSTSKYPHLSLGWIWTPMHGTFFAVEEHLVAIVSTSLFCVYPGHDLMSLLYHFMDEFLFVFSAEPFFIAGVCTKNKNSAILNNLILTVFCISHAPAILTPLSRSSSACFPLPRFSLSICLNKKPLGVIGTGFLGL